MDIRFSPMIHFFLNLFLLWDFQCIFALEEWKKRNGPQLRGWLETIGEFEVLSSLAVIPVIHPNWAYPACSQTAPSFTAAALGHPLIHDDKRVCNDINITGRILVITGSNMSGKTTMLRTVGINLVLAFAGAPVCAADMACSVMDIYTSMRISDMVESIFKTIARCMEKGMKLIAVIGKTAGDCERLYLSLKRKYADISLITGAEGEYRGASWLCPPIFPKDWNLMRL